jgi:uncharacterized membrane protein YdbT with pleckstrin-like domain
MKYVERVLQPEETVKHWSKIHWTVYLPGLLVAAVGLLATGTALAVRNLDPNVLPVSILYSWGVVGLFAVAGGLIALFVAWLKRATTEIAVTNRRIIYKTGLIRRNTIEMNMDKVETVDVEQSVLGRILGYGTVTIKGTGAGIEPLRKIDRPIDLRNSVMVK